ncbi:MAG: hypothetical protein ACKOBW_08595 [Planctomycetota bacterium]
MLADYSPYAPLESHHHGLCFRAVTPDGKQAELRSLSSLAAVPPQAALRSPRSLVAPSTLDPLTGARLQRAQFRLFAILCDSAKTKAVVMRLERGVGRVVSKHKKQRQRLGWK